MLTSMFAWQMGFSQDLLDTTMMKAMNPDGFRNTHARFKNFSCTALDGKLYNSDSLETKVTFISFWFEACAPCIAEFEALGRLYEKYNSHRDFQFLSFTFETIPNAARVAEKYNLNYPVLCIEQKDIHELIFQLGFPTSVITDRSGTISFIKCGGPAEKEKAQEIVDSIYAKEIERLLKDE